MAGKQQHAFRILRYFSITSLISILIAALFLTWIYRLKAVGGMVRYGENNNIVLAQCLFNSIRPELTHYLAVEELHHAKPLSKELAHTIIRSMENTSVVMIGLIDDEGDVVYSTKEELIGQDMKNQEGFLRASGGDVYSQLSPITGTIASNEPDNMTAVIHSYIPIDMRGTNEPNGVFVVTTDVANLMNEIGGTQYQVFLTSAGVMTLLYLVLLVIVRNAERIITRQEVQLKEHSRALELLSSQLITAQEIEKYRVAHELHEGIAQSLSSVMMRLERVDSLLHKSRSNYGDLLEPVVPLLHDIINEVRSLALEVRPPSLDELGLLATVRWYTKEISKVYPHLSVENTIEIDEEAIPQPLKVVIFRSLEQCLQAIAGFGRKVHVVVKLFKSGHQICLEIMDDLATASLEETEQQDLEKYFVTMSEFIAITGGKIDIPSPNIEGGSTLCIVWES